MLKHFQVPDDIAIRVNVDSLRTVTERIFMKCGVSESEAYLGADVLMFADQSGIDTHGVSNMLRSYVSGYNSGTLNPVMAAAAMAFSSVSVITNSLRLRHINFESDNRC